MTTVFDVAKYILEKQGTMSTMKLQKLCYYAQAWSLVWDDEELFPEEFEAWANGPVCRTLYNAHQGLFKISSRNIPSDKLTNTLTENQKDTIDHVLEHYSKQDAQWLSTLTHMEAPWRDARKDCAPGQRCNNIITKASMVEYYGSL